MAPLSQDRYLAQLHASTATLAGMAGGDLSVPVPTCPEWTLRELLIHVGRAQRWSALITATRSAEFIPFRSVPDGKFPGEGRPQWVRAGASALASAVREAGEDEVWALGRMEPASFWARRSCHETLVHEADAVLAAGGAPAIEADVAADAIDEWLTELCPRFWSSGGGAGALPPGQVLHVHATDTPGEWLAGNDGDGVQVTRGHGKGDAAVTGPAADLLLMLLRRTPADAPALTVHGDPAVLTRWLGATAF
ncbi:MAG TPA: maleylpyruvate isomerase family mycothiol-dependent enzyme [Streptosporangiaceae bacterium]|jgi:uncharacterized protein (TIGR03083 family)